MTSNCDKTHKLTPNITLSIKTEKQDEVLPSFV